MLETLFHGIEARYLGSRNKRWPCSRSEDGRKPELAVEVVAMRELTGQDWTVDCTLH